MKKAFLLGCKKGLAASGANRSTKRRRIALAGSAGSRGLRTGRLKKAE